MEYRLTEHARDALARRQIPYAWVESVLSSPQEVENDTVDVSLEHRLAPIEEFGGRMLRVIVNMQVSPPRVVTAYFDRRRSSR